MTWEQPEVDETLTYNRSEAYSPLVSLQTLMSVAIPLLALAGAIIVGESPTQYITNARRDARVLRLN